MPSTNKKHLRETLNSKFIAPIFLGISFSLILTCTCLILLTTHTMRQKKNRNLVETLQQSENQPLLLASEILIVENYQPIINALAKIEAYAAFLNESTHIGNMRDDFSSKTEMKTFVNKYAYNVYEMLNDRKKDADEIINNKTNFDYSVWIINERKKSINHVASDIHLLKLMYLFANLHPLFHSIYETLNVNEQKVNYIYIAVESNNLFYKYPMFVDPTDHMDFMGSWCVTDEYMIPQYYYFKCQQWFIEAYRMINQHKVPISISYPYFLDDNTFTVTICLFSFLSLKDPTDKKLNVLYCINTMNVGLKRRMNYINNLINGYIFIVRVESKFPIYYPNEFNEIQKEYDLLEFPFNKQFSLDEILQFNSSTFNDYYNYNDSEEAIEKKGNYTKNGDLWKYTVIPIYYYYDYGDRKKIHLFNMIYTENCDAYIRSVGTLLTYDFVTLISPIFAYAIQGIILVLIAKYLVNVIASSIVLPMKNIKKILEKLNIKKHVIEKLKQTNEDNDEENEDKTEEEEDNEDDEEYINVRSKDIQDLFVSIIELKDSLATLNLRNDVLGTKCLPNYIFATEIFKQRKKMNAYLTCNANVGNLLINCDKYDIAIMHLIESENCEVCSNNNQLNSQIKSKIDSEGNTMNQQEDKNAQENIKYLLESRYPKLIYSFKQYFSYLNKISKEDKTNKEIQAKMEFYASKGIHHIQLYESTVKKYQELARSSNQAIRLIYANLEYIEYYIKYEIKIKRNPAVLPQLKTLIEETKMKIKEKKHFQKPKRIYKSLINNSMPVDSIEISKDILLQRLYYLQGYLALCCKNYHSAIEYLFKITEMKNTISDAKMVVQSFKKLVKLGKMYRREYSNTAFSLEGNLLDKFISMKEKEIKKFVSEEKDFVIIINTYTQGNSTFIKAAFDKAKMIYENYVCSQDRFGIMFFGNDNINLITKLEFIKGTEQSDYLLQLLQQYGRDDEFSKESQTDQEEDIESLLIKIKAYIAKKSLFQSNRILFLIVFSNNLSKKSLDYLSSERSNQILKKKIDNLIIVVQNSTVIANEQEINQQSIMKNNSYEIHKIDNVIHNLKAKLRIYGNINDYFTFSMEKSSNSNDMT